MGWVQPPHATSQALRAAIPFAAFCVTFVAYDVWRLTKHDGSTWCEITREVFHTDTPEGEALYRALVGVASAAYLKHILR